MAKKAAKSETKSSTKSTAKSATKTAKKVAPKSTLKAMTKAATKVASKIGAKVAEKISEKITEKVAEKTTSVKAQNVEVVDSTLEAKRTETPSTPSEAQPVKAPKISAKQKKASVAQAIAQADANKKWLELKEKHGSLKAADYRMTDAFEANTPIQHKSFGWGFILTNDNNRLEVLFESGTRQLISNYKS